MLTRKPRKGDQLEHVANYAPYVNGEAEADWQPLGTVSRCDGSICWFKRADNDEPSSFIWYFREGLNKLTRIVPRP